MYNVRISTVSSVCKAAISGFYKPRTSPWGLLDHLSQDRLLQATAEFLQRPFIIVPVKTSFPAGVDVYCMLHKFSRIHQYKP